MNMKITLQRFAAANAILYSVWRKIRTEGAGASVVAWFKRAVETLIRLKLVIA